MSNQQPPIQKKTPEEAITILEGNLMIVGQAGVGKSVALKTFASSLIQKDKRVLMIDHFGENREFVRLNKGVTVELASFQSMTTFPALTNLLLPHVSSSHSLPTHEVLNIIEKCIQKKQFDYIFLDESQWYLSSDSERLIYLLQYAKESDIKTFITLQSLLSLSLPDEVKDKILGLAPEVLMFDGKDVKSNTKDSVRFAKGESLLFHIKDEHPLYYVHFDLSFEELIERTEDNIPFQQFLQSNE